MITVCWPFRPRRIWWGHADCPLLWLSLQVWPCPPGDAVEEDTRRYEEESLKVLKVTGLALQLQDRTLQRLQTEKQVIFGSREIEQVLVFFSDFQRFWCSLDRSLQFYESDRSVDPCMQISVKDIICLGISRPDSSNSNGSIDRFVLSPLRFLRLKQRSTFSLLCLFQVSLHLRVVSDFREIVSVWLGDSWRSAQLDSVYWEGLPLCRNSLMSDALAVC